MRAVNSTNGLSLMAGIAVIGLTAVSMLLHQTLVFGWNDASRWATVWSLTHGRGYAIDDSPYKTGDQVMVDGHFYSSKPALLPTTVAGLMSVIPWLKSRGLSAHERFTISLILFVLNLVPFISALYLYGIWMWSSNYSPFTRTFCMLAAAFGTYLTAYNLSFNNHTVAACGVFFAVFNLLNALSPLTSSCSSFVLCGVSCAWVVVNELHAVLFGVLVASYLLWARPRDTIIWFAPGALVVLAAFFLTNYAATDGLVPFYLKPELYHYPGSPWNSVGDASGDPKSLYLFNYILGHHGILSLSPVFLFSFLGIFLNSPSTPLKIGTFVLTVINTVFVLARTNNYGGVCMGPRWFFWLIPLWLFCLPSSVEVLRVSRGMRWFMALTLSESVFSVLYGMFICASGPWGRSWLETCLKP